MVKTAILKKIVPNKYGEKVVPNTKKNTNTKNTKEQKKAKVSADISNYLHHLVQLYAEAKY